MVLRRSEHRGERTLVLGLDGLDARLVFQLMRQGRLPGMVRLAEVGGLHHVLSTTPAESGVAWTAFSVGANPGHTGIFDFVERGLGSYSPRLAGTTTVMRDTSMAGRWTTVGLGTAGAGACGYLMSARYSRRAVIKLLTTAAVSGLTMTALGWPASTWLPRRQPVPQSTIQGQRFWDVLAEHGERTVAMRMPLTFPAQAKPGVELLAGLGVPDVLDTNGTYHVLTDTGVDRNHSHVLPVQWHEDEAYVKLLGPENHLREGQNTSALLRLRRHEQAAIEVRSDAGSVKVDAGQWSGWLPVHFHMSPLWVVEGRTRLFNASVTDRTFLYVTPVEFDAANPSDIDPISAPKFACDLEDQVGPFRTIGWETQTWGLVDEVLHESAYLKDLHSVLDGNETMLHSQLGRHDWDHLLFIVQATDQASHVLFDRHIEQVQNGAAADIDHPLVWVYRRMDALVDELHTYADAEGCRLLVMSDHGFAPFRRNIHLNTWLARRGWLARKDRDRWDSESADNVLAEPAWSNVDWFQTRAYALGLSGIYLNVAGREPEGIVKPGSEYEFLQQRLIRDLLDYRDPQTAHPVFANVCRRQDIYDGPCVDSAPDLIVGLRLGHRVSSATVVGGIPEAEVSDQRSRWCGDHCGVDPPLIPGVCLTNFATAWPQTVPITDLTRLIWPQLATAEN